MFLIQFGTGKPLRVFWNSFLWGGRVNILMISCVWWTDPVGLPYRKNGIFRLFDILFEKRQKIEVKFISMGYNGVQN